MTEPIDPAARPPTRKPRLPLALRLYRAAGRLATPLAGALLARRRAAGKEDGARLGERRGHAALPRQWGVLVWIHAASVGETLSILPLVGALAGAGRRVLVTTGTVTSARIAADRLPPGAIHQFVPLDLPGAAARFLAHWHPDLALFCESEIWPNLMLETRARGIALGIINGRMSPRSFGRWRRALPVARALLGDLAFCLAQSAADAARYRALGAPARAIGNLKFDAPALPVPESALAALRRSIGERPILLAASTHPGEEELVLEAAARVRAEIPDLLTIVVPRHPGRGAEIASRCAAGGLRPLVRSQGAAPDALTALYLADTLGELGLFYALATLAFIGGSLVPIGGHNPIEPARLGVAILHGPDIHNFRAIYAALDVAGAAVPVADAAGLAQAALRLIGDAPGRAMLATRARGVIAEGEGALEATLAVVNAALPAPEAASS